MLSSLTSHITAISALLWLCACSSYGWAEADSDHQPAASIYVEPVSAPAHLGIDTASLRAHLIDELERQSVAVAASASGDTLYCALHDERNSAHTVYVVARITLSCDIRRPDEESPRASLRITGLSTDSLATAGEKADAALAVTTRASTRAAQDAISRLAPRVSDELQQGHQTSPDEQ